MKKLRKLIVFCLLLTMIVGCNQQSEVEKAELYTKEVTDLVTSKGYTVEELAALQHGQRVNKAYDNEVLERFGKVLVYEYLVSETFNDGFKGAVSDNYTACSILPLDEYQVTLKNEYIDDKHFTQQTAVVSGYIIVDAFYIDGYESRSYNYIPDANDFFNRATGFDAPAFMEESKLKDILASPANENKWYQVVNDVSTGETGKQLIFPLVIETE